MRLPKPIGFALIVVAAACEPTVNGFGVITTATGGGSSAGLLAFLAQPAGATAGAPITPAIQIIAQDTLGNVLTGFNSNVTLAIGTNPASGTLSGRTTVAASGGLAAFDSLRIDKPGAGYTLTATTTVSGVSAAISSPFTIF